MSRAHYILLACIFLTHVAIIAEPADPQQTKNKAEIESAVLTNSRLGMWVGVWRVSKSSLLLTNSPFPAMEIPNSLELRIYPYNMDFNAKLTHNESAVVAEMVAKDENGQFQLWDEGWPIAIYPWEISVGPIGSPRRFRYVLTKQGRRLALEMVSSSSNVRLHMEKVADDCRSPVKRNLLIGRAVTDDMLRQWEEDYHRWLGINGNTPE